MRRQSNPDSELDAAAWDPWATILAIFLALWIPVAGWWLGAGSGDVSATENRFLAAAPGVPVSVPELRSFPARAEAYFDDRMGFRTPLIRANALLHVTGFGISPSEKLIVGKQGWFFFHHPNAVAQARGAATFSATELVAWKDALLQRRDWLEMRDVAYVFVLAPNKHAIYSEHLPDTITTVDGPDPHLQLAQYLAAESDLNVVDLMPTMLDRKRVERVYHKTDTHWNDRGAYHAYLEVIAAAARGLPGFPAVGNPTPVRAFERQTPGMGLTSIVGLSRYYGEEDLGYEKTSPRASVKPEHRRNYKQREQKLLPLALGVADQNLPRAVVFRDSFANALVPYLSENFSRVVFAWNRDIDPRLIQIEQPDIVIHEVVGRFIDRPPEAFDRVLERAANGRASALEEKGKRRE